MEVGARVTVCGSRTGTIRYIGAVEGFENEWVGIEWDDPEGGKHNGTVKGKTYFTTSFPKNGSFVRSSTINFGDDLLTAISKRYKASIDDNSEMFSTRVVELVGMKKTSEKQSDIFSLINIVLDDQSVSRPPPPGTQTFQLCRELNLYGNLLHKWEDIKEILSFFPSLTELVLRRNRMDQLLGFNGTTWPVSSALVNLVLSECEISDETISNILAYLSSITHLHALRNNLTSVTLHACVSERLTYLDLEGNPLKCFSNLKGVFPNLSKLSLTNCLIEKVELSENCRFPVLANLSIKENNIVNWESIQNLQYLPKLSVLYIDSKNFTSVPGIAVHEVIIAKLSGLLDLNRFDISPIERRSAEIRFLGKYFSLPPESLLAHKNDVDRLIKVHGPPAVEGLRKCLDIVKITIMFEDRSLEKKLPLTITIHRLIDLLSKQFSVDPLNTQLELDRKEYRVPLDNPMRPLGFYSPEPTDILRLISL